MKVYRAISEDLERVIIESVEYEEGMPKHRFTGRYDDDGELYGMAIVQGHGKEIQELLDENQYMVEAAWLDGKGDEIYAPRNSS